MSKNINSFKATFCIALVLITFICFAPSLGNDFTNWDDDVHLTKNPAVLALDAGNIVRIFLSSVNDTYIPLTTLSFAIEHHFFRFNPLIYHFNNIALHLGVVVLIYILAMRLGLSVLAASAAALLFGIHPMHVESVAWVTERKDVLYALFYIVSLLTYIKYQETRSKGAYILSVICALLSILAKPMALSLPLVLFVCDWFKGRPFARNVFLEKIPYFLSVVPIAWITYSLNARVPEIASFKAPLIWLWSLSFYIQEFIFPARLFPLYSMPEPVSLSNGAYLMALGTFILLALAVYRWRRHRLFLFACLYFFVSIFFLLRFDNAVDRTIVADRFMYLPSLGFCLVFGVFVEGILKKAKEKGPGLKWLAVLCTLAVFAALGIKTSQQSMVWKDSTSLWDYTIEHNPRSGLAYLNRGHYYRELEDFDRALADYNQALAINPGYVKALYNRGNAYVALKEYELALADYQKALSIDENYKVYFYRAELYRDIGHYDLALTDYSKALILDPAYDEAYHNRGAVYGTKKQYDLAVKDFSSAIALNPNYATAYFNRSMTYFVQGRFYEAYQDALRAASLDHPVDPRYLQTLQQAMSGGFVR